MLLAQDIRPMSRSPQQRLVSIAIVAGIHVTVLAAILTALSHTLTPTITKEITLIPTDEPTVNPPPQAKPVVTLVNPTTDAVPKPVITIEEDDPPTRDDRPQPGNGPPGDASNIVIGAQAIFGTHTTPDYPPLDRRLGHEGNVLLMLAIDERGVVVDTQVERSSGYEGLDQAAANWVKSHWRYHPATRAGDAIPSNTEVTVTFRLTTH
jgi:periplasmic protein TonB